MKGERSGDYLLAFAAGFLAFALYLRTLAPGLLGGDSGELQFAAWLAGFVHPTGYPLYLILGHLWTHLLPLRDPAWRLNVFSALWGGAAVGLVYLLVLRTVQALFRTDAHAARGTGASPEGGLGSAQPTRGTADENGITKPRRVTKDTKREDREEQREPFVFFVLRAFRVASHLRDPNPIFRAVAFFAALTFAVTPTFWSQAVIAEVYTLHAAFVAAVLLGLVTWAEGQDLRWLYATAAFYGLSLTHHRTMLLLAPAIIVFVWLTRRRRAGSGERRAESKGAGERKSSPAPHVTLSPFDNLRTGSCHPVTLSPCHPVTLSPCHLVTLSTCLLLPLLLYAYIPLRAPLAPYASVHVGPGQTLTLYEPTWRGFLQYVAGQAFQGEIGTVAQAASRLVPAGRLFVHEVTWAGVALGLIGLLWLARRHRPLLALTGLGFLAVVGFNLFYGIGDIYVFYIPAYLIWVLWVGLGVAGLSGQIGELTLKPLLSWLKGMVKGSVDQRTAIPNPQSPIPRATHTSHSTPHLVTLRQSQGRLLSPCHLVSCLLALILPAWLLFARYPQIDQSRNDRARATWQAILTQPVPRDAILVSNDRDEMMPLWYLQYVEGVRSDLTGLFPLIQPGDAWSDVGQTVDSALRSGRPVLLIKPMPGLEVKFRLEPALPGPRPQGEGSKAEGATGALVRVLGPAAGKAPAHPLAITYADAIRLAGYDLHPETLAGGQPVTLTLYWQPLRRLDADYATFVHLLDAEGRKIAQSDHRPGGVYYPTSLWRPGETLADTHTFALPPDPGRPPYTIIVGLYTGTRELDHLGQPQQIRLE